MKDEYLKEIDLIQNCINRMSQNSFLIKGWALTIFAAVISFMKGAILDNMVVTTLVVIIPFVCFWLLDAYYLKLERQYRHLYKWVIEKRKMGDEELLFDLNTSRFSCKVGGLISVAFSKTLLLFYGLPTIATFALFVYSKCVFL